MQQILIDTYSLGVDLLEKMRSHFMPDTTIFLQSYFVMGWIAETPVNIAAAASLYVIHIHLHIYLLYLRKTFLGRVLYNA